jgi:hypothetical protein
MTEKYRINQVIVAPLGTRLMACSGGTPFSYEEVPLWFMALAEDAAGEQVIVPLIPDPFGKGLLSVPDLRLCGEILPPGKEASKHHYQCGRDYV